MATTPFADLCSMVARCRDHDFHTTIITTAAVIAAYGWIERDSGCSFLADTPEMEKRLKPLGQSNRYHEAG
jgi:hypothetical protein